MSTASRSDYSMITYYNSLEEATEAEKAFALKNGYCLKIRRTQTVGNKTGGLIKGRILLCVHSGTAKSEAQIRDTSTLRQDCPFQVRIRRENDGGDSWSAKVVILEHNHEPTENIAAYPSARTLTESEMETVDRLSIIGAKPRTITSALAEQNSTKISTTRDIQNIKMSKKRKMLDGRTQIEALLDMLVNRNIWHSLIRDKSDKLTGLFISPTPAQTIIKKYTANKIFLMDTTYKTNRYQMPLLHGVGVTATNETFTLFYCFLRFENEEFYIWAMNELRKYFVTYGINCDSSVFVTDRELALMNALSTVFPRSTPLLCIWHINKNILAKNRSSFGSEDGWKEFMAHWQALVNSFTAGDYNERLEKLRNLVPERVFSYLSTIWLRYKERFVLAFTRHVRHFGHVSTSRVEGAHAVLKNWLQVSTGDMLEVCMKLERGCDEQEHSLSLTSNYQRTHNLSANNQPLWERINRNISRHAITLARKQYLKSLAPIQEPCTNTFTPSMGIPCSHRIKAKLENALVLNIDDFDVHWWLVQPGDMSPIPPLESPNFADMLSQLQKVHDSYLPHQQQILVNSIKELLNQNVRVQNPVVAPTRGRPTVTTRRNLSSFELVEQSNLQQSSCSICNIRGHNSRTCPRGNLATSSEH